MADQQQPANELDQLPLQSDKFSLVPADGVAQSGASKLQSSSFSLVPADDSEKLQSDSFSLVSSSNAPKNPFADMQDMSKVAGADPGMESPVQAGTRRPVQPVEKENYLDAVAGTGVAPMNSAEAAQNERAAKSVMGAAGNDPEYVKEVAGRVGEMTGEKNLEQQMMQWDPAMGSWVTGTYNAAAGIKDALTNPQQQPGVSGALKPIAQGANRAVKGAMTAMMPSFAVGAWQAPIRTALTYYASVKAGAGAQEVAKKLGMDPEFQELANTVGSFIPIAFHQFVQAQGGFGETTDRATGQKVQGGAVKGRGFGFVAGRGEDGSVYAAGRVGPFSARAKWGGAPDSAPSPTAGGPPAPQILDPIRMLADERASTIRQAAIDQKDMEEKAADVAGGVPPPEIPKPAGMDDGVVTPKAAGMIARVVQMLPEQFRPQAILESVGNLAKWLHDKKTIIGPDGKVTTVDTAQGAQKAAVKIVNDEIERQGAQQEEAQKQQEEQQKQEQEDADTARQEREESMEPVKPAAKQGEVLAPEIPDNPHTQLAKRILAGLPDNTPAAKMDQALRDKILLETPIRKALVAEEVKRRHSEMESRAHEEMTGQPTPEGQKAHELDKWVKAVKDGEEPFAHIAKDTTHRPQDTEGLSRTSVKGAKDADGIYYHDAEISSADIREAARKGTLDQLREAWKKGKSTPKPESDNSGPAPAAEANKDESQGEQQEAPTRELSNYEGEEGKRTKILLADGSSIPATHRMVDLSSLNPSHNGQTFAQSPSYPAGVQERSYHSSKDEQMKVIDHEQKFEPSYIVNTNPDATNGAPIVTSKPVTIDGITYPAGTVLGGNSRAMTLQRVYTNGADAAYREALQENHRSFGFTPEAQEQFSQPVHVREIEPPKTLEEMHRLGSLLNKPPTQSLDNFDQAVSLAKHLSQDTLTGIADIIRNASDADSTATLNAVLGDKTTGRQIVKMLEADGIITETNRGSFIDSSTALLTTAARNQLGNALLANILDSRELMQSTPFVLKQKMLGSIGSLSAITATDDGWNLKPALKEAADQYGKLSRMPHATINEAMAQEGMFADRGPVIDALIRGFDKNVSEVRKVFSLYTTGAMEGRNPSGMLVGLSEAPDPYLDFNFAFGTELTKEQFDSEMAKLRGGEAAPTDGVAQTAPATGSEVAQASEPEPTNTYAAEVSKFAGDPHPKKVTIEAINRRHAEQLLKEKYPDTRISDPYRIASSETKAPEAETKQPEAETAPAERPFVKGEKIKYKTNKGKIRDGEIAWTDGKKVRIKDGAYDFSKNVEDVMHLEEPKQETAPAPVEEEKPVEQPIQASESTDEQRNSLISFLDGKDPRNYNDLKKLVAEHDKQEPTQLRMKEAQEAYEAMRASQAAQLIYSPALEPADVFQRLVQMYENQPNLSIRTSTSITNQAYSTPLPLAFVTDKFAGIDWDKSVYEPTAGNGNLLIAANPDHTLANELEDTRALNLAHQEFRVSRNDASKWTPNQRFDSVVANPPFGSLPGPVDFDGYTINKLDHLITLKALSVLKDDGKASIIIGASKMPGDMAAKDKPFFNYLYSHYNVVADFELNGDLYSRQGASWPVRVIAIDGRAQSAKVVPPADRIERLNTWENVYDHAVQHLGTNLEGKRESNAEPAGEVRGDGTGRGDVQASAPRGDSIVHQGESETSPEGYRGGIGSGQPGPIVHSGGVPAAGVGSADNVVSSDADVAHSDRLAEDQPRQKTVRRDPAISTGHLADAPVGDEGSNQFQSVYTPFSEKKDTNVLAPKAMLGAMQRAMESLSDQIGDIDQFVADELGYSSIADLQEAFMGLQVDTIAAAIHGIRTRGTGIIIADQTGIGKGRQAAAIIRWAELHGHIPIFQTAKAALFTDMFGDLHDIGSGNSIRPWLMNADATITHPVTGAKVFGNDSKGMSDLFQRILETGKLPEGNNAVFTTYSQVQRPNKQQLVLQRLAPQAVFILDEAHKAGGDSNTGVFMRGLLDGSRGAVYLSATYAKRPDNLPLYAGKTDIGMAIPDKDKIVSAIEAGGAPLQAVVSYQLAQAGQLFRREKSFDGISFPIHVAHNRKAEHEKTSDSITEVLRAIVEADSVFHEVDFADIQKEMEELGESAGEGGNHASETVNHMEFSSIVHNLTKQMLLGLKADDVSDKVIADIQGGKKPIIALENTMGSFLESYAEQNSLLSGAPLHGLSYGTVLQRALDRTRYYNHTDKQGRKTRVEVPLSSLSEGTRALYDQTRDLIQRLKVNIPVSPIDHMRNRIEQAGFRIAEITGRNLRVDYSRETPTLAKVPTIEKKDRVATARGFNNGQIHALILNMAGSTGISLHASEKFQDQNPRKMYVVQPAADINEFMQMLGRINRTGQVKLPEYEVFAVDLPAETRPAMNLAKKMKSLNANTSSNTRSAVSIEAPDMMNKYGDKVVTQYLADNHDMAAALRMTPGDDEDDDSASQDVARKATGRSALLPVAEQKEFMEEITSQYKDLIEYLDATGQNDLEPKTLDLGARELHKERIYEGTDPSSPFGQDAHFGMYSIKRQGKPFTPDEVKEMVREGLNTHDVKAGTMATPENVHRAITSEMDKGFDEFIKRNADRHNITDRGREVRQMMNGFMQTHRIGSGSRVNIDGEDYNAVVTNIEPAKNPKGNPYAASSIKYTLALNGSIRGVKITASEFQKIMVTPLSSKADINSLFYDLNPDSRMKAGIVTGNLLGAYGTFKGNIRGKIISYTNDDGSKEMGILMPSKFNPKEHVSGDYCMRTAEGALKVVQNHQGTGAPVSAPNGDVQVVKKGQGLAIKTKLAKAVGGKFYKDKNILAHLVGGEFYSSNGMMVGDVMQGHELDAIKAIMGKAALYSSTSMIDRAREYDAENKPQEVAPKHSLKGMLMDEEGSAPAGGIPPAAVDYVQKAVPATWNEITKAVGASGKSVRKIGYELAATFAPATLADHDALDIMGKAVGEPALRTFQAAQLMRGVEKMFQGLTPEKQVEFIDRWQNGRKQASTDLQNAQELMQTILDEQRARENEAFNLGRDEDNQRALSDKENYFPNRYKVPPSGDLLPPEEEQVVRLFSRRPFAGSKTFLKEQKYTMKEAVDKGAKPLGTPVDILKQRLNEGSKYVAAATAWHDFKEFGLATFVRNGKKAPDGYEKINDRSSQVFRHIVEEDGREGYQKTGEWYVQRDAARLLNNYLSTDHIRNSELGTALVNIKNLSTEMKLAMSPFHFGYITVETFASALNTALDKMYNQGVRDVNFSKMMNGVEDLGKSVLAPYTAVKQGGQMLKFAQNPDQFLASPEGQRFAKLYPDFPRLQQLLFHGGLRWGMADTFKSSFGDGFLESMKAGELGKSILKAAPWVAHLVMRPLFDHYIPRAKWVFATQMLSQKLAQYSQAIASGSITEEQIARDVAATTDNRFGEFNWDSLWLNNTLRTGMQLTFRSATWKIGSWRGVVQAGREQFTSRAFDDRIFDKIDADDSWLKEKMRRLPQLGMNAGWILSMGITVAVVGSVISKLASHRWPWEWAKDDNNGLPTWGSAALEAMHPRTGAQDDRGMPIRVSFPTGLKDYEHGLTEPGRYIKGSMSDLTSNFWDTLDNRDAFGNYVYNPNDPAITEFMQGLKYNLKGDFEPMSSSNYRREFGPQDEGSRIARATGMLGGAPKYLDQSSATRHAVAMKRPHDPYTPEQEEAYQLAQHQPPTRHQVLKAAREKNYTYLEKIVLHDLSYAQAREIYEKYANPQEKQELRPIMERKRTLEIMKARRGQGSLFAK